MTSVEKSGNGVQITMPGLHVLTYQVEVIASQMLHQKFNDRHEWKLNEDIFRELCEIFGVPNIYLFASRLNKQVSHFCSWQPDPDAEHFDAFSISWSQFDLAYIFPSFALIARCLQKMCAEMARGWLIVPMWPSQPWMGTLLKMLINKPQLIMSRKDVLRQPSAA